jgi:hypothetical protein
MFYDGVEYKPGRDGKFRCEWGCHNPQYHRPSWRTEKGFLKHLEGCPCNPKIGADYRGEPEAARFGTCGDCGGLVWKYTAIWQMVERWVCFECRQEYQEAGEGFLDCAGLQLPKVMLEGF